MATDDDVRIDGAGGSDDLRRVLDDLGRNDGHDEPCAMCGKSCDVFAADPGKWPLSLVPTWRGDYEPGRPAWHCTRCVMDALATLRDVTEVAEACDIDAPSVLKARRLIEGGQPKGWGVWCASCSTWTYKGAGWAGWPEQYARRMAAHVSSEAHMCEARRLESDP